MNRKIISFAIAFLLCVGLCSAGFAAWVITAPADAMGDGTIEVDTVTDNRLKVTLTSTTPADEKIVFGKSVDVVSNPWLTQSGELAKESLTVTFSFKVEQTSTAAFVNPPTVDESTIKFEALKSSVDSIADLNTAVSKGYILQVPTTKNTGIVITDPATDESKKVYTFNITVTFGWGEHFGTKNPYVYYNGFDANAKVKDQLTYAEDAKASLTELESLLRGMTFKLTVTVK